jgi:hypothetical protein
MVYKLPLLKSYFVAFYLDVAWKTLVKARRAVRWEGVECGEKLEIFNALLNRSLLVILGWIVLGLLNKKYVPFYFCFQ